MARHGVDISRYQGAHAMDGWDFVIINSEDPTRAAKVERARSLGIPWGWYGWVYPVNPARAIDKLVTLRSQYGEPPLGYALDIEQAGVGPWHVQACFDRAREVGMYDRLYTYTYLYLVAQLGHLAHERALWLAYYPGRNDGSYPGHAIGDALRWGSEMWQYTSGANAPVGLDRNVVISDEWFDQMVGGHGVGGGQPALPTPDLSFLTAPWRKNVYIGVEKNEGWFLVENGIITLHFQGPVNEFGVPKLLGTGGWVLVPACEVHEWDLAGLKLRTDAANKAAAEALAA